MSNGKSRQREKLPLHRLAVVYPVAVLAMLPWAVHRMGSDGLLMVLAGAFGGAVGPAVLAMGAAWFSRSLPSGIAVAVALGALAYLGAS